MMRALPFAVAVVAAVALPARAQAPRSAKQERALKPKQSFKECAEWPEMVVVPAGSYMMGSPRNERARDDNEGPRHRVTVKAFALGKFEVTVDQFTVFVTDTGHDT